MTADGVGVVAHAGSVATRLLADRVGLTDQLSKAMARRSFVPVHDRGRVLVDVAVLLADGGEAISDIDVLRHQSDVLGPVASPPTVWRALDEVTPGRAKKIAVARARTRRHVWAQLAADGGVPPSRVAGRDLGDVVVLDVDATIVIAHSEKERAAATFKRTFGYHPIGVWCDNTTEFLAATLRAGNAGSNTTADHIEVLSAAIAQIPAAHRHSLLIRSDGAGASHGLLDWLHTQDAVRGRSVEYSVGFAVTEKIRDAIKLLPAKIWVPAVDADGEVREGGDVVELTGLLDLSTWPPGMRVIVRRERPHPGAQLSLFEEVDGYRYQAFVTNTAHGSTGGGPLAFLEARHRAHARVEDRIRHAKDSGLGRLPSREFAINQTWLILTQIAADLTALDPAPRPDRRRHRPGRLRAESAALPTPARARAAHSQRPPNPPTDPGHLALGHRCRSGLRQHRRDPTAALTPPIHPPHQYPENRSPAAPAGLLACHHSADRQPGHPSAHHHRHESPGLGRG